MDKLIFSISILGTIIITSISISMTNNRVDELKSTLETKITELTEKSNKQDEKNDKLIYLIIEQQKEIDQLKQK